MLTGHLLAEFSTLSGLRELVRTGTVAAFIPRWMEATVLEDRFVRLEDEIFDPLTRSLYVVTTLTAQTVHGQLDSLRESLASIWRS